MIYSCYFSFNKFWWFNLYLVVGYEDGIHQGSRVPAFKKLAVYELSSAIRRLIYRIFSIWTNDQIQNVPVKLDPVDMTGDVGEHAEHRLPRHGQELTGVWPLSKQELNISEEVSKEEQ